MHDTTNKADDDRATILALDIGGDDMGAAWLIARRSPNLSRDQVANAAKNEGQRDMFGRRRLAKLADGSTESAEQYRDRTARRELARQSALKTAPEADERRAALARTIRARLGELGDWLANGIPARECAARLGVTEQAVSNRLARIRREFSESAEACV